MEITVKTSELIQYCKLHISKFKMIGGDDLREFCKSSEDFYFDSSLGEDNPYGIFFKITKPKTSLRDKNFFQHLVENIPYKGIFKDFQYQAFGVPPFKIEEGCLVNVTVSILEKDLDNIAQSKYLEGIVLDVVSRRIIERIPTIFFNTFGKKKITHGLPITVSMSDLGVTFSPYTNIINNLRIKFTQIIKFQNPFLHERFRGCFPNF